MAPVKLNGSQYKTKDMIQRNGPVRMKGVEKGMKEIEENVGE